MATLTIATWLFIITMSVSGICAAILSILLRFRRWPKIFSIVLSVVGMGLVVFVIKVLWQPIPCTIDIVSPTNNMRVEGKSVLVAGTVKPVDANVTVMISSEDDERWWIQEIVQPEAIEGDVAYWSLSIAVGTDTEGSQKNFHIVALASADSQFYNEFTGRVVTEGPYNTVPVWESSSPVVIRRIR